MNKKLKTLLAIVGATFFVACEDSIYPGYEKTESGLFYKFYASNDNEKLAQADDYVVVKMLNKITINGKDSTVYDSRLSSQRGDGTVFYKLTKPLFKGALEEGLAMMHVGDSASFIINTDSIVKYFYPNKENIYPKGTMMVFDIKLLELKTEQAVMAEQQKEYDKQMKIMQEMVAKRKAEEPVEIEAYVKKNEIKVSPEKSGYYLIETVKGTGKNIKNGDKIAVNYTGKFLDGSVFDTNVKDGGIPYEFSVGNKEVIPGWDEALLKMKKGSKATIIVPSSLAYDSLGVQDQRTGQFLIPPYTTLVFDVEIVDVK